MGPAFDHTDSFVSTRLRNDSIHTAGPFLFPLKAVSHSRPILSLRPELQSVLLVCMKQNLSPRRRIHLLTVAACSAKSQIEVKNGQGWPVAVNDGNERSVRLPSRHEPLHFACNSQHSAEKIVRRSSILLHLPMYGIAPLCWVCSSGLSWSSLWKCFRETNKNRLGYTKRCRSLEGTPYPSSSATAFRNPMSFWSIVCKLLKRQTTAILCQCRTLSSKRLTKWLL